MSLAENLLSETCLIPGKWKERRKVTITALEKQASMKPFR